MRGYVASKYENKEEVRKAQRLLEESGHVITHDWTWEDDAGKKGEELRVYRSNCASKDYNGVASGDFIFLINFLHCAGAYTEFGIALACNKLIVVVDGHHPEKTHNIFFYLPGVNHFDTIEEAVAFVNYYAQTGRLLEKKEG